MYGGEAWGTTPLDVAGTLKQPVSWWVGLPPASIRYKYPAVKLRTAKTPDKQPESETKPWVYSERRSVTRPDIHCLITVGRKPTKRCWTSVSEVSIGYREGKRIDLTEL